MVRYLPVLHSTHTPSSLHFAHPAAAQLTHFVPSALGFFVGVVQAEHVTVSPLFKHVLQSAMPPLPVLLHDTHLLIPLTVVAENPSPQFCAVTQEVACEFSSVFR